MGLFRIVLRQIKKRRELGAQIRDGESSAALLGFLDRVQCGLNKLRNLSKIHAAGGNGIVHMRHVACGAGTVLTEHLLCLMTL